MIKLKHHLNKHALPLFLKTVNNILAFPKLNYFPSQHTQSCVKELDPFVFLKYQYSFSQTSVQNTEYDVLLYNSLISKQ